MVKGSHTGEVSEQGTQSPRLQFLALWDPAHCSLLALPSTARSLDPAAHGEQPYQLDSIILTTFPVRVLSLLSRKCRGLHMRFHVYTDKAVLILGREQGEQPMVV